MAAATSLVSRHFPRAADIARHLTVKPAVLPETETSPSGNDVGGQRADQTTGRFLKIMYFSCRECSTTAKRHLQCDSDVCPSSCLDKVQFLILTKEK